MRFNINAPFWRFMDTLLRFVGLNLVYLITLIPNVTIGPARAALYSTMFAYDEHDDIRLVKEYLTRFKREFKQGLAAWVLVAILATAILFGLSFWKAWDTNASYIPLILLVIAAVVVALFAEYVAPLQARFANTTGRLFSLSAMFPWRASPARSSSSSSTYSRPACHISYRSYAFSPSSSASPGWRMRNPSFCCGASNGMAERAKWRIRNMSMRTSDVAAALRNHALSVMNISGLSMNLRKPTSAAPYNAGWSATNGMDTLTCMSDAPKTCDSKRFSSVS